MDPANAVEVSRALEERGGAVRPFPRVQDVGDALRITIGPWNLMESFLRALDQLFESESPGLS